MKCLKNPINISLSKLSVVFGCTLLLITLLSYGDNPPDGPYSYSYTYSGTGTQTGAGYEYDIDIDINVELNQDPSSPITTVTVNVTVTHENGGQSVHSGQAYPASPLSGEGDGASLHVDISSIAPTAPTSVSVSLAM